MIVAEELLPLNIFYPKSYCRCWKVFALQPLNMCVILFSPNKYVIPIPSQNRHGVYGYKPVLCSCCPVYLVSLVTLCEQDEHTVGKALSRQVS